MSKIIPAHRWFAWRPVRTNDTERWVWLRKVYVEKWVEKYYYEKPSPF